MGYTNLTDISLPISPFVISTTAGTWTPTISTALVSNVRSAAAAAFSLIVPVPLPASVVGSQGAKLISLDFWYKIATKAATAFTVAYSVHTLSPSGSPVSAAAAPQTLDANHDSAAKCYAIGDHKLTSSITTPLFLQSNQLSCFIINVTAADTTVFSIFGAQANFVLRI